MIIFIEYLLQSLGNKPCEKTISLIFYCISMEGEEPVEGLVEGLLSVRRAAGG